MSFLVSVAGIRSAPTRGGDTLQAIALRELGDAAKWADLASLNNLSPPYLSDVLAGSGPRVLWAGAQNILIPATGAAPAGVAHPVDIFGTDIALPGGRLTADAGGGIATTTGVSNLSAALSRRLSTRLRELLFHPDYGNGAFDLIGRGASTTVRRMAAAYLARAVRSDPRVDHVANVKVKLSGDTLTGSADAVALDGKRVPTGIT